MRARLDSRIGRTGWGCVFGVFGGVLGLFVVLWGVEQRHMLT